MPMSILEYTIAHMSNIAWRERDMPEPIVYILEIIKNSILSDEEKLHIINVHVTAALAIRPYNLPEELPAEPIKAGLNKRSIEERQQAVLYTLYNLIKFETEDRYSNLLDCRENFHADEYRREYDFDYYNLWVAFKYIAPKVVNNIIESIDIYPLFDIMPMKYDMAYAIYRLSVASNPTVRDRPVYIPSFNYGKKKIVVIDYLITGAAKKYLFPIIKEFLLANTNSAVRPYYNNMSYRGLYVVEYLLMYKGLINEDVRSTFQLLLHTSSMHILANILFRILLSPNVAYVCSLFIELWDYVINFTDESTAEVLYRSLAVYSAKLINKSDPLMHTLPIWSRAAMTNRIDFELTLPVLSQLIKLEPRAFDGSLLEELSPAGKMNYLKLSSEAAGARRYAALFARKKWENSSLADTERRIANLPDG